MAFSLQRITLAATILLLCTTSSAAPQSSSNAQFYHRDRYERDTTNNNGTSSTAGSNTSNGTTFLEPVIPPQVDDSVLLNLAPTTSVSLAWAGAGADSTPGSTQKRVMKRDGALLATADLGFKWPAITLDHSAYVSGVSCSNGVLTGTLTSQAYSYAKKKWPTHSDLVFITAADTCGPDNANVYFHATSLSFADPGLAFTAQGTPAINITDVTISMVLQWGDIGTHNLRRSLTKRALFVPHGLQRRIDWGPVSSTIEWSKYLNNDEYLGTDENAPWDNAAKLFSWSKSENGAKPDDSYKKGEVASATGHHKRSNETSLMTRGESEKNFDYGVGLYCVECGFGGSLTAWGFIKTSYFTVVEAKIGLNGHMELGLYLGLNAFVTYENKWTSDQKKFYLVEWGIEGLATVGPFIGVQLQASFGVEASGQLLVGAGAEWPNIDITLDLKNPSDSSATGLAPNFLHKAEAQGELEITAGLGLPVELGIGLKLIGGYAFEATAGIVDTPSINFEGTFEISASVLDNGTIEHDINGGCYGIAWNVFFQNDIDFRLTATGFDNYETPLVDPYKSAPIAEGCIGYVKTGTDNSIADGDPEGSGADSGMTGNGMNDSEGNGMSGGDGEIGDDGDSGVGEIDDDDLAQATTTSAGGKGVATTTTKAASTTTKMSTTMTTTTKKITTTTKIPTTTKKAAQTTKKATTKKAGATTKKAATTTKKIVAVTTKRSTTTTKKTSSTTSNAPTCTSGKAVLKPNPNPAFICGKKTGTAYSNFLVGKPTKGMWKSLQQCADYCIPQATCMSFSWSPSTNLCTRYSLSSVQMTLKGTSTTAPSDATFYDRTCYGTSC
ncbi:hypothetical protein CKM354_001275800 [Cercospora kikuchii]|uniref:Apple domain-containing protein n=1 Tax=Cercospora kikuchii TaxID=84275 RepID=A0A9P3FMM0_9PEZI|nr:uncharacterized protein CKM354_001275800 [Cercospora kikuchii]GIZ49731.1 hypothetical protein CKM354_001275800 [Cercospora kikuchii]